MTARLAAVLPAAGAALALAVWIGVLAGLAWLAIDPAARAPLQAALAPVAPLLVLGWVAGSALLAWAWWRWIGRPGQELARLAEQVRSLQTTERAPALRAQGPARALAEPIQALAAQRDALREGIDQQVRQASSRVQAEKDRLAALLAELPQSVLVCNLDGRILLYNQRAQQQLGSSVGIGRPLHGLVDQALLQHALSGVRQRLARGDARPAAQFVTYTPDAQLLRVQLTPVLAGAAGEGPAGAAPAGSEPAATVREVTGLVLLLDDVTRSFAEEAERDRLLSGLTEGSRSGLAAIRAAVEMLGYEDVQPAMRERFLAVLREESTRLGGRIDELARRAADEVRTRWPLEDMLGEDFAAAALRHLHERAGRPVRIAEVAPGLWLRVDSYSLLQALAYLARRLVEEFDVPALSLRVQAAPAQRVHLDLIWSGHAMSTETVMGWELDPIQIGAERSQLSVREVVMRHDGEMWFERDRARHQAFLRFLLPQGEAGQAGTTAPAIQSRPEFYDFDLFQQRESDRALDERRLAELRYTVFDTETTGLDPAGGDEIIQIGAVRVVNGRVLSQETFDQLVDPGRDVPEVGIAIHGITPQMLVGQPRIETVLPAFHRFAEDTVLVAHNAAFDMKFLQLLQPRTGVVFDQRVLDTLLLSQAVHPSQQSHALEAIAARFGVNVAGRHTALGDARVTADLLLHLISQLASMGIHTLGDARTACERTYYARLKY